MATVGPAARGGGGVWWHRQSPLVMEEHEVVPREHDGPTCKVGVDERWLVSWLPCRRHALSTPREEACVDEGACHDGQLTQDVHPVLVSVVREALDEGWK